MKFVSPLQRGTTCWWRCAAIDPPATVPLARAQQNALLLNQLPADLRKKIATENALRIYSSAH